MINNERGGLMTGAGPARRGAALLLMLAVCGAVLGAGRPPNEAGEGDEPGGGAVERINDLSLVAHAEDPVEAGVGTRIADVRFVGLDGAARTASAAARAGRGLVIAMTSTTCPLSNRYGPELARLEKEFAGRGVAFVFVNAQSDESPEEMARHARETGFTGLYADDRRGEVVAALGARTTTEVFVVDSALTLVYRGAVDDQFGVGVARIEPGTRFLREALEAMLAGGRPRVRATWSPGCLLEIPDERARAEERAPSAEDSGARMTYHGGAARLIGEFCVACHRPGGPGPFALDTYAAVDARASMMSAMIRQGLMPPWHGGERGAPGEMRWANDRRLPERERRLLLEWLSSSRTLGDPGEAPAWREEPGTWAIGEPDVTVSGLFDVPAESSVGHVRVTVPIAVEGEQWLEAVEVRPAGHDVVQRALIWIREGGADGERPEAGASGADESWKGLTLLASYSPGDAVRRMPAGCGVRVTGRDVIVMDVYTRGGAAQARGRVRVGLRWSREMPARRVVSVPVLAPPFELGAGERREIEAEGTVGAGGQIVGLTPLLGPRGRSLKVEIVRDGAASLVLAAPRYDWRWLIRYEPLDELEVADGSGIRVSGMVDATAENPANPEPGAPARSGRGAREEMVGVIVDIARELR
ncbi:MAG: redoxin family protein [Planctomycetota bacterium]|nr:redoxin family protein [Planctomycetota bacterium]